MTPVRMDAPWHKASYDRFLQEKLPELLASRVPLASYRTAMNTERTCAITLALESGVEPVELRFERVPVPDENGVFAVSGGRVIVVPVATSEDLGAAEIRCVGEQLYGFVEKRIGEAPRDVEWDKALAKAWLPLGTWIDEFLRVGERLDEPLATTAQRLDDTNWLSARCHLRRLLVPKRERAVHSSEHGRVCPYETPEGPNIGHMLSIAAGAEIRDGKLCIVAQTPEAALGVTALMVPQLEHNDANRQLMGVNMMRQWQVPLAPEPALVQTGHEVDAPGFWCGVSLLTAFTSMGGDTYEDGIVLSESAARRFRFEHPVEPGDKLSNRHGTKGVVARILPDDEMPHLGDGTPVELVFSFTGYHTRLNFGQFREAILGRVARAEGQPVIVAPFGAPSADEVRDRLRRAGLPESGMETLTRGKAGPKLARPTTVGYVYWGRTAHDARTKIHAGTTPEEPLNIQGELEYCVLRDVGAYETVLETFNTRCALRPNAATLAERVSKGPVAQAGPPTPGFSDVAERLRRVGILAELDGERLRFRVGPVGEPALKLARPVEHPWLRGSLLEEIGVEDSAPFKAVRAADSKLRRLAASGAPDGLVTRAHADLEAHVHAHLRALLEPAHVRFSAQVPGVWKGDESIERRHRVLFSGRAVLAPGPELTLEQVGLPDEIAWVLFGPLAARAVGAEEVAARSAKAAQALDEAMAGSWVILNRAPSFMPTNLMAFRPVRIPDKVIRIHVLACMPMNGDFDGDQAAVFLPVTEAGQREAAEKLSVAGHLRRDPSLLKWFCPNQEIVFGIASLSMQPGGREQVDEAAGIEVARPEGFVTRESIMEAMERVFERDGVDAVLAALERLMRLGLEVAAASGASMSPFIGSTFDGPAVPEGDAPETWDAYMQELNEAIASSTEYASDDFGVQLLMIKSGARGGVQQLRRLLGSSVYVLDPAGGRAIVRHSFVEGFTPEEMSAHVTSAREGLAQLVRDLGAGSVRTAYGVQAPAGPKGFGVLARAMRSDRPGIVFARAAANEEVDPLTDLDSRLFVGLKP